MNLIVLEEVAKGLSELDKLITIVCCSFGAILLALIRLLIYYLVKKFKKEGKK